VPSQSPHFDSQEDGRPAEVRDHERPLLNKTRDICYSSETLFTSAALKSDQQLFETVNVMLNELKNRKFSSLAFLHPSHSQKARPAAVGARESVLDAILFVHFNSQDIFSLLQPRSPTSSCSRP